MYDILPLGTPGSDSFETISCSESAGGQAIPTRDRKLTSSFSAYLIEEITEQIEYELSYKLNNLILAIIPH